MIDRAYDIYVNLFQYNIFHCADIRWLANKTVLPFGGQIKKKILEEFARENEL
jgi:hypothetical protein